MDGPAAAGPGRTATRARCRGLTVLATNVLVVAALTGLLGLAAPSAQAQFPYPAGINRPESPNYKLAPGVTPTNFSETGDWELSATPNTSSSSVASVDEQPDQLCGIRGISLVDTDKTQPVGSCVTGQPVKTAFQQTTGNPDVVIAVLDSGIEWNDAATMANLADKIWLNTASLPAPRHDLSTPLATLPDGKTCADMSKPRGGNYNRLGNYWPNGHGGDIGGYYDVLHLGVVNVLDWACDSRVAKALYPPSLNRGLTCPGSSSCKFYPHYHGPITGGKPMLTPEDLILAFSDGRDHAHNGYVVTSRAGTSWTTTTTPTTRSTTATALARRRLDVEAGQAGQWARARTA